MICPYTHYVCDLTGCGLHGDLCPHKPSDIYAPMGWMCPRCQRVHAPSVLTCGCSPRTIATTSIRADINT